MTAWIISIVGIVLLGVLIEIIIPDGKTNGFIKSIFSIIFMFVVISPIIKLINKSDTIDLTNIEFNESKNNNLTEQKLTEIKFQIENHLRENGVEGADVEVMGYSTNKDIIINQINVEVNNLVILNKDEHINKYKLITKLIKEKVEVDEKNIVYG
jgi:stage III sporulation protein AF